MALAAPSGHGNLPWTLPCVTLCWSAGLLQQIRGPTLLHQWQAVAVASQQRQVRPLQQQQQQRRLVALIHLLQQQRLQQEGSAGRLEQLLARPGGASGSGMGPMCHPARVSGQISSLLLVLHPVFAVKVSSLLQSISRVLLQVQQQVSCQQQVAQGREWQVPSSQEYQAAGSLLKGGLVSPRGFQCWTQHAWITAVCLLRLGRCWAVLQQVQRSMQ